MIEYQIHEQLKELSGGREWTELVSSDDSEAHYGRTAPNTPAKRSPQSPLFAHFVGRTVASSHEFRIGGYDEDRAGFYDFAVVIFTDGSGLACVYRDGGSGWSDTAPGGSSWVAWYTLAPEVE